MATAISIRRKVADLTNKAGTGWKFLDQNQVLAVGCFWKFMKASE